MRLSEELQDFSLDADIWGEMADTYADLGKFELAAEVHCSPPLSERSKRKKSCQDKKIAGNSSHRPSLQGRSHSHIVSQVLARFESTNLNVTTDL